jgi:hypothetical protein
VDLRGAILSGADQQLAAGGSEADKRLDEADRMGLIER